jgi:uncharacterized protein (DUF2141 family)
MLGAALLAGFALEAHAMDVEVIARGLRNQTGSALFAVFLEPTGFPGEGERAAYVLETPITGSEVRVTFTDLPDKQPLAIAVLHDEDGDRRMATGFFGIPKEGFGVSNNPRILFGPPSFREALLTPQAGQPVIIDMRYF